MIEVSLGLWMLAAPAALAKKPKKGVDAAPTSAVDPAPPAPTGPPTVTLPCDYAVGLVHTFDILKKTTRSLAGRPASERSSHTLADLEVTAYDAGRAEIAVGFRDTSFQGETETQAKAVDKQIAALQNTTAVRLVVQEQQVTVDNLDEVTAALAAGLAQIEATLKAEGTELSPQLVALKGLAASPELVSTWVLQDLEPLFAYTCGDFVLEPRHYASSLPNPLGGEPFPSSGTLVTTQSRGSLLFKVEELLDPVKAAEVLAPMLERQGTAPVAGEAPADLLAKMRLDVRTEMSVEIPTTGGWPIRVDTTRTVTAMGGGRTDTAVVTMIR